MNQSNKPLDPSKVKAGDTVTVHVEYDDASNGKPYDITGEVALDSYGSRWIGPVMLEGEQGYEFTLTDHQPAPEPEPVWESGQVAVVKFDDLFGEHRAVYKYGERRGGIWELLAGGHDAYADETSVVRPLVVIDPVKVDVDALYEAVLPKVEHDLYRVRVTIRKVLAELGIRTNQE